MLKNRRLQLCLNKLLIKNSRYCCSNGCNIGCGSESFISTDLSPKQCCVSAWVVWSQTGATCNVRLNSFIELLCPLFYYLILRADGTDSWSFIPCTVAATCCVDCTNWLMHTMLLQQLVAWDISSNLCIIVNYMQVWTVVRHTVFPLTYAVHMTNYLLT